MNNIKRSFIIDYACMKLSGHNLHVVNLYKDREKNKGRIVKAIVCKRAKSIKTIQNEDFDFLLPVIYYGIIVETIKNRIGRFYARLKQSLVLLPFVGKNNILDLKASMSVKKLFEKYKFNNNDLLIFPTADYYSMKALLKKISNIKIENRPRVHFRFIGSFEVPHHFYNHYLPELARLVNENYQTVSISAEIPVYARYLNGLFVNNKVIAEPYLAEELKDNKKKNNQDNENFTILLPGSNRAEKGYFDVFQIAKVVLFEFPNIRFVVQDMNERGNYFNKKYRKKLSQLANVSLSNAVLSRKEIEDNYNQADLILLHYDPNIYHFRGSGIHYEAIQNLIPVLAKKEIGFAEEIENWSSGWTYETKQDLLKNLKEIIAMKKQDREKKMEKAFKNFKQSSDEAHHFNLS